MKNTMNQKIQDEEEYIKDLKQWKKEVRARADIENPTQTADELELEKNKIAFRKYEDGAVERVNKKVERQIRKTFAKFVNDHSEEMFRKYQEALKN